MTYFQHARLSMNFSYMFLKASKRGFHSRNLSDNYITSTSDTVKEITKILEESGVEKS